MAFRSSGLITLLVFGVALQADDKWPEFRGPTGDGVSSSRNLPTHWSEQANVCWKTAIPGKAWSSPVIWDREIWMTNAAPDGKRLSVVCVDRDTGAITREINLCNIETPAFCHPFNSPASPTPAIEAGRLYAHFGSAGTWCVDTASGRILWQRRDLPCDHWRGPGSSPVIFDNMLVLTFDGHDQNYLAALDKTTGKTIWRTDRAIEYANKDGDYHKAYSTPAIVRDGGRAQLVSPSAEATIAYDAATGKEIWRVNHGGMNTAARPVFGHGLVFLTSGHNKQLLAAPLGATGNLTSKVAWKTSRGVPSRPSLLLHAGLLFAVSDDGLASCLDAKTGNRFWQERLGGGFSASPIYSEGKIYFAGEDGKTHVVAAKSEFQSLGVNALDAGCMASPAAIGDCIYLRTKTHLYCLRKMN